MSAASHHLTHYPLKWIRFGGLHPNYNSTLAQIHCCFNIVYFSLILVLSVMGTFMYDQNNIYNSIESLLSICLYLHIMGKYAILHFNKPTLAHLLEERLKFWDLDTSVGKTKKDCFRIIQTAHTVIKYYLGYSCLVASSYLIQPFFTGQLPVFLYVPEGWYYFLIFSFWYLTPSIVAGIWGVDTIYYSISIPLSVQMKLLADRFEHVQFDKIATNDVQSLWKVKEEIKYLINYHNFLLDYCKKVNSMCSGIFFIQFLVAIGISCMQLFIASQNEFNTLNKFKCLSYFIMQIGETAIYCHTAELMCETASDIGNAVYKSSWYKTSIISLRKYVVISIIRSQKLMVSSAFGLIHINMETFTRVVFILGIDCLILMVFKTALSFYTYLNTMVYND